MTKGSCMCGAVAYEYTGEPQVTALYALPSLPPSQTSSFPSPFFPPYSPLPPSFPFLSFPFLSPPTILTPYPTHRCHCTDCQKWSGGPCTSNVVVARKAFQITKGKPKNYNIKGDSGKMNDHWFCGGMRPPLLPPKTLLLSPNISPGPDVTTSPSP